ncbi:MAG: patatin, partial [candidate division Zixibacteria bacterium]|nr:patatin [candidate division Zixibacteria bacterium]
AIAGRSISSLIRTQGIGDLFRLYQVSKRDGIDFNLAYIPDDFEDTSTELFDPVYMGKLFDLGYRMGKAGYPWKKKP